MRSRYFLASTLAALIVFLPVTFAGAQDGANRPVLTPLEGPALEAAFSGKTMDGIYKIPRERTGTNKFTESFNVDGTTEYFEGPIVDGGQWFVRERLICFQYNGALSGGISCFNVFRAGTCLYSYNPANIAEGGYPYDENRWSVKTITRGDISSCEDLYS